MNIMESPVSNQVKDEQREQDLEQGPSEPLQEITVPVIKKKRRNKFSAKIDKRQKLRHAILGFLPWRKALLAFGLLIHKSNKKNDVSKGYYYWKLGTQKHPLKKLTILKVSRGKWEYRAILYAVKIGVKRHITAKIHTPVTLCMEIKKGGTIGLRRRLVYNDLLPFFRKLPFSSHVARLKQHNMAFYLRKAINGNIYLTVREPNLTDAPLQRMKLNAAYVASKIAGPWIKHPTVLIYEKKAEKYEESAAILYERLVDRGYDGFKYVITDEGAARYGIQKRYHENLVKKGSFQHYFLFFLCETFISTEAPAHAIDLRVANAFAVNKINNKHYAYIFLQHGVMYMVSLSSKARKAFRKLEGAYPETTRIVASSNLEASHFIQHGEFSPEDIYITGLPKFDKPFRHSDASKIVIMPTWRPWEYNSVRSSLLESGYYRMLTKIIASIPEEQVNNIIVLPHPLFKEAMAGSDLAHYFSDETYEQVLQQAAILITDYSSISYDAFNRGAEVIFWWADKDECMEKYGGYLMLEEATAFGPVVYDQHSLSASIDMALEGELDRERYMQRFRELVYDFGGGSTDALIERLEADGFLKPPRP